ncbi:MAG: 2,3,4,5-tetrahydropyridine-2,6-dicarboxylate N-succinyltransferase [Proteobacteria bacterium]|jgi:2,3,4,5-tetrahydropyridine-2,6-dicarboxylate N-succinyltransferase|nr:2,3,4,5-tetrahydropyridine-2,6-dicarboxylate N-succinyltransferase [Pseudomonadota bacterium]MBK7114726.1 2,3,4,5-tetrahydropyridine-2,6-dicarboxylate N-succinyltransferase [Pseudomonadota bacterium]MBK9251028.1 2,3,4,5-tetrahydropyridine-2,6-dicarboxylate N-succinyltransferase [Pseudomonadota bacterium]MCC6632454.1 2,3,4,5-tetrahydropyridine-2,6-dicarboxylate N-succinyltransferase [Gammaproteobacteria bacterium]
MTDTLRSTIEAAFERRAEINPANVERSLRDAIEECIGLLDSGRARVAEKQGDRWVVNEWLKKAVLLSFRANDNQLIDSGAARYYDKVQLKFADQSAAQLKAGGVRVVPPATARRGAYIAPNVVLMPSYVNIGAYVDSGTMVDTWATVGSCAQIGRNVHLSGGVGIGGVLEPLQASPTIIEDDCFIGARSEVVEGVIVGEGSVLAMGVFISQSTRIYDRATGEITYGRVPPGSVVVPGSLPSADGKYSLACAIIVKRVDAKTRAKTSINELLRSD